MRPLFEPAGKRAGDILAEGKGMKTASLLLGAWIVLTPWPGFAESTQEFALHAAYTACFTPGDNCEELLVGMIGAAKRTIHMQAYSFTDRAIAAALVEARGRGLEVIVLLDKSQRHARNSMASDLAAGMVTVLFDDRPAIAHNKTIITDPDTDHPAVETGSFNFTYSAEHRNAENALIISGDPVQSMQDVVNRTPNVSFITSGSRERDSISIRGLSDFTDPNNLATIRANTFGFYIDEFNVASATSNPGVVDMDRIRNRLCDRHGTLGRTRHGAEPAARQPSQRRPWRAANDPHVPRRSDIGGL